MAILFFLILVSFSNSQTPCYSSFESALRSVSDAHSNIVLIVTNSGFHAMVHNSVKSAERVGVHNLLVVTTSPESSKLAMESNLKCYEWTGNEETDDDFRKFMPDYHSSVVQYHKPSHIGVGIFRPIVKLKHFVSAQAIKRGYNVLTIDSDIFFNRNPFPYFMEEFDDFDIWFQLDNYNVSWPNTNRTQLSPNSGFIFNKANKVVIEFYDEVINLMAGELASELDQPIFWIALTEKGWYSKLRMNFLPQSLFPVLPVYEMLSNNHEYEPLIIHFNWLIGIDPKIHELKEKGKWLITPDSYYSQKYVMLEGDWSWWNSLRGINLLAVASLLGRIPILPIGIRREISFKEFNRKFDYRAGSFPQDPRFLRGKRFEDLSMVVSVHTNSQKQFVEYHGRSIDIFVPSSNSPSENFCGLSSEQLKEYLGNEKISKVPVLVLTNPENLFNGFHGEELEKWREVLKYALKHTIWNDRSKWEAICWWWGKDLLATWIEDEVDW